MGNRAVITTGTAPDSLAIYIHWNGGPESVLAFLDAARELGVRDPLQDDYGMARLCQIIGDFMGPDGWSSLGIGKYSELDTDNGDNGVYILGPGFKIAGRAHVPVGTPTVRTSQRFSADDRKKYKSIKADCIAKYRTFTRATAQACADALLAGTATAEQRAAAAAFINAHNFVYDGSI